MTITPITTTDALNKAVEELKKSDYFTIDTEFLRTTTFFAKLCLIQVANDSVEYIIDPLAHNMDLTKFYELLDGGPIKVFHASRQDLEIFYHAMGKVPSPIFDTQVAAMVCGYGDSAGYETLVKAIARKSIDKSIRFTDWSKRPLSDKQLSYALSDVTHLKVIYKHLAKQLEKTGRTAWLKEEFKILTSEVTYKIVPEQAWHRIKCRSNNRRFLAFVRAIAAFREREAEKRNSPRNHIMRDDLLLSMAAHPPSKASDLKTIKNISKRYLGGEGASELLAAIEEARALSDEQLPEPSPKGQQGNGFDKSGPSLDLLKVLLKLKCAQYDVAAKLVASSSDLDAIATGSDADVPCLKGWRYEIFGHDAKRLMNGELFMSVKGKEILLKDFE